MSGNYNLSKLHIDAKNKNIMEVYLGPDQEVWKFYNPVDVVKNYSGAEKEILIDMVGPFVLGLILLIISCWLQGGGDTVYRDLTQSDFLDACENKNISLVFRIHRKYHHAYEFIQTFIEDHFKFHVNQLKKLNH